MTDSPVGEGPARVQGTVDGQPVELTLATGADQREQGRVLRRMSDHPVRWELVPFTVAIIVLFVGGLGIIRSQARADRQEIEQNTVFIGQLCKAVRVAGPNALDKVAVVLGADAATRAAVQEAYLAGLDSQLDAELIEACIDAAPADAP